MINTTNTMTNTMINNFDNLVSEQRYLFYAKFPVINNTNEVTKSNNTIETTEVLFRANFIKIITNDIGKTIITNNVDCQERGEINKCGILSSPLDWITKVEKIDDVVNV